MKLKGLGAFFCAVLLLGSAVLADGEPDTLTVDASGKGDYLTVQEAINAIAAGDDKTNRTILVRDGEYPRFVVTDGLDGLTVKAAPGAAPVINTLAAGDDDIGVSFSGAYPNTDGIAVRAADNVTVEGLSVHIGRVSGRWYGAALSCYSESTRKAQGLTVRGCTFTGENYGYAIFICAGTGSLTVSGCTFINCSESVTAMCDGTAVDSVSVTGSTFRDCSFAVHGYFGGTGGGTFLVSGNTVTGTRDLRSKIVLQDQLNTGALKVNIRDNGLNYAMVGLINLREPGETITDVLTGNSLDDYSFYAEAADPGTESFYVSYRAPEREGSLPNWYVTGTGMTGEAKTALEQAVSGHGSDIVLNIAASEDGELIHSFTRYKDGIYLDRIKVPGTMIPKTGDSSLAILWCGLVLGFGTGVVILLRRLGRRE